MGLILAGNVGETVEVFVRRAGEARVGRWSFLRWLHRGFERVAPLLAGVLPLLGIVLLVIAAGFAVHSWNFARTRVRAMATITENVSGFAKEGGVVYTPRFRFRLPSGELVTVQAAEGSEEIEFRRGRDGAGAVSRGRSAGGDHCVRHGARIGERLCLGCWGWCCLMWGGRCG